MCDITHSGTIFDKEILTALHVMFEQNKEKKENHVKEN